MATYDPKDLLRRIEAEDVQHLDDISNELFEEIEKNLPPEIVARGYEAVVCFLQAF